MGLRRKAEVWDSWRCPHPECAGVEDEYEDPSSISRTSCAKGHSVRLVWRDGSVSARMPGGVNRHDWRINVGGWFCWRCNDSVRGLLSRRPVYGCVTPVRP
jgi:hypothetical protein